MFTSKEASNAVWGCCVRDLTSGKIIYTLDADAPLIPASNQKLLVAAAALIHSGSRYQSQTRFLADGPLENGVLHGNLVVSGYGAIHFTARYRGGIVERLSVLESMLDRFASRFRKLGIREIRGKILIDCTDWTDMPGNLHYPSAAALSFHENTLDIAIENGAVAHCPKVLFGFMIQHHEGREAQKKVVRGGEKTDGILVNLKRDSSDYWRLDRYSPLEYYRNHIQNALVQRGIVIKNEPTIPLGAIDDRYLLFRLDSLPMGELLQDMGLYSDNFRAETIFLNLGYLVKGKANYDHARAALLSILNTCGLQLKKGAVFDGSGLSRDNRISAAALTNLLRFMMGTGHKDDFLRCLPVSGESGTLKNKLLSAPLRGRVLAKTGTLQDVTALSGYILKRSEPVLSFSFICNKASSKKQCWRILDAALKVLVSSVG